MMQKFIQYHCIMECKKLKHVCYENKIQQNITVINAFILFLLAIYFV